MCEARPEVFRVANFQQKLQNFGYNAEKDILNKIKIMPKNPTKQN